MPRDYYMVLGVERGANRSQIKHAYRSAIKRYHPDRFGTGTDPNKFMAAQEAYEVLSDRDRRRAYDAELRPTGIPVHLTHARDTIRRRRERWNALRETRSPLDDFFEGIVPGFFSGPYGRRPAIPKDLYMEVVLTPEEALHGGIFPVAVPVFESCRDCSQNDWPHYFYCPKCRGYGAVRSRRTFDLTIPPGVADGTSAEVPLVAMGLPGLRLYVHVRVEPAPLR